MELSDYIEIVKDQLTGFGILESELDDNAFTRLINMSLKELKRYYNSFELLTVPADRCIDLEKYQNVGTVVNVFRAANTNGSTDPGVSDPAYMSMLQMYNLSRGGFSNNYAYRISSYNTMKQIANTVGGTDLQFKQDKHDKKLYVNYTQGLPSEITIEYIPVLREARDVVEDFWQDILVRLSVAHAKVAVGRIRSRYTQSQALWSNDGKDILTEGLTELKELRDRLRDNADLVLPID